MLSIEIHMHNEQVALLLLCARGNLKDDMGHSDISTSLRDGSMIGGRTHRIFKIGAIRENLGTCHQNRDIGSNEINTETLIK